MDRLDADCLQRIASFCSVRDSRSLRRTCHDAKRACDADVRLRCEPDFRRFLDAFRYRCESVPNRWVWAYAEALEVPGDDFWFAQRPRYVCSRCGRCIRHLCGCRHCRKGVREQREEREPRPRSSWFRVCGRVLAGPVIAVTVVVGVTVWWQTRG